MQLTTFSFGFIRYKAEKKSGFKTPIAARHKNHSSINDRAKILDQFKESLIQSENTDKVSKSSRRLTQSRSNYFEPTVELLMMSEFSQERAVDPQGSTHEVLYPDSHDMHGILTVGWDKRDFEEN